MITDNGIEYEYTVESVQEETDQFVVLALEYFDKNDEMVRRDVTVQVKGLEVFEQIGG